VWSGQQGAGPGRKPGASLYTRKRLSLSDGVQGESQLLTYTRGSLRLSHLWGLAARVTRYDPMSIWEIDDVEYRHGRSDINEIWDMGHRRGIWVTDMEYEISIWLSTMSMWSSWILIWDMG
jgi:hypothetical protein